MFSNITGKHVVVTGANGFVGKAVVKALLGRGVRVRTLCGPPAGHDDPGLCGTASACADICDTGAYQGLFQGADAVVHLAGPPSVRESFAQPELYRRVHVDGTAAILDISRTHNVRRFIYLSSAEVYGRPTTNPVSEGFPLEPRSPYGAAKAAAEKMIDAHLQNSAMSAIVLRAFSIYGQGQSEQSLIASLLRMIAAGTIEVEDLRPIRDYCHVRDLADAVERSIALQATGIQTLNIGTGVGTSVANLATMLLRTAGCELPIRQQSGSTGRGEAEIYELIADRTKALAVLQWRPTIELAAGLKLMLFLPPV